MQIEAQYSHLNGLEYMLVHHCALWDEIQDVIARVDAEACKTKVSKERTMPGKLLYSPGDMNKSFKINFKGLRWMERRNTFWVTADERLMRGIYNQARGGTEEGYRGRRSRTDHVVQPDGLCEGSHSS